MMEYKNYLGQVEFDDEGNLFHGEVLGIRDVVTFQGKSVTELRQAFEESVDDYLEFCKDRGESPDKPFSGRFVLRISPELHRKLFAFASTRGESLNSLIARVLEKQTGESSDSPTVRKQRSSLRKGKQSQSAKRAK